MDTEISELEKLDCKTSHMAGNICRDKGSWSGGRRRILAQDDRSATYHVMSRTTGKCPLSR